MKKYNSYLYLSIAGFHIVLHFEQAEISYFRSKLIQNIKQTLRGFIQTDPCKKVHYTIDIREHVPHIAQSHIQKSFHHYIHYYIYSKSNRITTFYTISLYQFLLLLMIIVKKLLAKNNGFILHASGVKIQNAAVLFTGKPGIGKSTAVKLLQKQYSPIGDDSIIIRKIRNVYYAYQTPVIEKMPLGQKTNEALFLKGICLLERRGKNKLIKIMQTGSKFEEKILSQRLGDGPFSNAHKKHLLDCLTQFPYWYRLSFLKKTEDIQILMKKIME